MEITIVDFIIRILAVGGIITIIVLDLIRYKRLKKWERD